ncbi:MAG: ATP-binding cassette domain-containing protein [Acidobacteriota bacterium]
MIQVENLRKNYGQAVAVDGISFAVRPGEIFGLLGPNGAGKTTTISVISGLLSPTSGSVQVDGRPMSPEAAEVKKVMGVVPQDVALYEELSARENLRFWGGLYGLSGSALAARVDEILSQVGLTERAADAVKTYSGGMKRRLNLGLGLVHEPRVLLLDEPTIGVDPQARINILDVVRQVVTNGTTVLYTTHYMQEAEELCDRIAIMDHGRILAEDTVAGLKRLVGEGELVTVRGGFAAADVLRVLEGRPDVQPLGVEDGQAMLSVRDGGSAPRLLQELLGKQLAIEELFVKEPSLEQVFIKLTGRQLRD